MRGRVSISRGAMGVRVVREREAELADGGWRGEYQVRLDEEEPEIVDQYIPRTKRETEEGKRTGERLERPRGAGRGINRKKTRWRS